jgi:hypothetical protein
MKKALRQQPQQQRPHLTGYNTDVKSGRPKSAESALILGPDEVGKDLLFQSTDFDARLWELAIDKRMVYEKMIDDAQILMYEHPDWMERNELNSTCLRNYLLKSDCGQQPFDNRVGNIVRSLWQDLRTSEGIISPKSAKSKL